METAVATFGGLDSMIHFAAASGVQDRIEDLDIDAFDATMALHVRASVLAVKAAIPPLRERGGGSITLTSSVAALRPKLTSPVGYVTGKAALSGLLKIAAIQGAPDFIRVNLIFPGAVPTRYKSPVTVIPQRWRMRCRPIWVGFCSPASTLALCRNHRGSGCCCALSCI